jgi:hypothetical protein
VIALAPRDEHVAVALAALDERLARELQRRFHGLRSAGDQIDVVETLRRLRNQRIGKRLGDLGGEEAGVRVRDLVDLRMHRGEHVGVRVPEAGHRRAAACVDVAAAFSVDDLHARFRDRDGRHGAKAAMDEMGHRSACQ